jgi:hypothetical protein
VCVCLFVCSLITRKRIHRFSPNLAPLFLETRKILKKVKSQSILGPKSGKGSFRILEIKQDKVTAPNRRYLCRRGDYRNNGSNSEKTVLGSNPGKNVLCSSKIKHDRRTAQKKIVCFGDYVTSTKVINPNTALGSSLGKDVQFRNSNNFP